MDFRLSKEQQGLQERCRELAADFATRSAIHDREASHPRENYQRLRDAGFLALTITKECGGAGASFVETGPSRAAIGLPFRWNRVIFAFVARTTRRR